MVAILFENPDKDVNVGSLLRSCNFFGVKLYLTNKARVSNGISAGAIQKTPPEIMKNLDDWKGRIIATDSSFTMHPFEVDWKDDDLIVLGNEKIGVSKKAKDKAIFHIGIPCVGECKCLNIAQAGTAILAIIDCKRRLSK